MRAGTLNVHSGLAGYAIFLAAFEEGKAVVLVLNYILAKALYIYALGFVFSDDQRILLTGVLE